MANEINLQAALVLQRSNIVLQGTGNILASQTGTRGVTKYKSDVPNSGAAYQEVTFDIGTLGYLYGLSLEAPGGKTIKISLANDDAKAFAAIKPGEFFMIPVNQSTVWVRHTTGTGTASIMFLAVEA
jgi:hypothetical protein